MYAGAMTVCLPAAELEASARFYEALGFERFETVADTRVLLRRGTAVIGLFTFLEAPLIDLRGADVREVHAAVAAAGCAAPGRPADYAAGEHGSAADGCCWHTQDPGGTALLVDTHDVDAQEDTRRERLAAALAGFLVTLEDLGADAACIDAYRAAVLEPFALRLRDA